MDSWLASPPGQYLLACEQPWLDQAVADVFGFHAVQLGLGQIDGLRHNRMPHRWLADDGRHAAALHCDFDALPFANQSLDLMVLPHALELARDPHDCLREVERVLRPEGRVVITGFNPSSLWGLRQKLGHLLRSMGTRGPLFLPAEGEFIGYRRVRDWLRLLGFEVEQGQFGCWRPAVRSQGWIDRLAWFDSLGGLAWSGLGAVYMVTAVKRVRGMRLVGLAHRRRALRQGAPVTAARRSPAPASSAHQVEID